MRLKLWLLAMLPRLTCLLPGVEGFSGALRVLEIPRQLDDMGGLEFRRCRQNSLRARSEPPHFMIPPRPGRSGTLSVRPRGPVLP